MPHGPKSGSKYYQTIELPFCQPVLNQNEMTMGESRYLAMCQIIQLNHRPVLLCPHIHYNNTISC
jgi:hypothetical protein